jgi:hypothetical protein
LPTREMVSSSQKSLRVRWVMLGSRERNTRSFGFHVDSVSSKRKQRRS